MATVRPGAGAQEGIRPVVASATTAGRRRRPSGEPPPLPRTLARTTRVYLAVVAGTLVLEAALVVPSLRAGITGADVAVVRVVEQLRGERQPGRRECGVHVPHGVGQP